MKLDSLRGLKLKLLKSGQPTGASYSISQGDVGRIVQNNPDFYSFNFVDSIGISDQWGSSISSQPSWDRCIQPLIDEGYAILLNGPEGTMSNNVTLVVRNRETKYVSRIKTNKHRLAHEISQIDPDLYSFKID